MIFSKFYEIFIALRFLRGLGRSVLFNSRTRLAIIFMSLMVFVIVTVLSIFEGFQREVRQSLWNSGNHIVLRDAVSRNTLKNHKTILNQIDLLSQETGVINSYYESVGTNVLVEFRKRFEGKILRAIPFETVNMGTVDQVPNYPEIVHYNESLMSKFDGNNYVLIGREMARYYNWQIGDKINIYFPKGTILNKNMEIQTANLIISGFFRTGFYEYDLNMLILSLSTAQKLLGLNDNVNEIVIKTNDINRLRELKNSINEKINKGNSDYKIETIQDTRGNFLAALELERIFMITLMGLLVLAGVAGIWVTSQLQIKSKIKGIGMLRAMGMPLHSVIIVFTIHSFMIGLFATIIGVSIGIYISLRLERLILIVENFVNSMCSHFNDSCVPIELIPKNIYYFDHLPVHINDAIIFGIMLCSLILCGIAGYIPARKASLRDPVESLRSE